jgi:hypothetical protein
VCRKTGSVMGAGHGASNETRLRSPWHGSRRPYAAEYGSRCGRDVRVHRAHDRPHVARAAVSLEIRRFHADLGFHADLEWTRVPARALAHVPSSYPRREQATNSHATATATYTKNLTPSGLSYEPNSFRPTRSARSQPEPPTP